MEAAKAPIGSDGLITLPYFMGERPPIWDPVARGALFGLSLARGHVIRSFMEAAAYALYQNFLYIRASGLEMKLPMVLVEGGAKSALWRRIIADVFDIPVAFMAESKGASASGSSRATTSSRTGSSSPTMNSQTPKPMPSMNSITQSTTASTAS